jgi:hypothetical protein
MQMSERYNKHFVSLGLLFHACHNCKKHPGEKEARRRLKVCQKKGTIERPKGTAGRDFSLQEAMNLDGKDTVFKKIRVSILSLPLYMSSQFFFHEYKIIEIAKANGLQLDTTIRYQPPTMLGTIITLVRVRFTCIYALILARLCSKSRT